MTQSHRSDNPFPGLRAFSAEEDHLFFGREEQTMELLQTLGAQRFVSVVGTSGSGKSSLVRCGLLSQLLGGKMLQAGTVWEVAVTHPGAAPMSHLADALLQADLYDATEEDAKARLMATLSRSHFGLVEAIRQAQFPEGTNFLLVVDQFEEIFRFNRGGTAQRDLANEFVSMLLEAANQSEVPIYIVLTMRSDFIGDCAQFENLAEAVNRGEYLIPRMTRQQFKQAIEGPIRVAGGKITARLLQRLLNDLGNQADQLPCLQHALMRTWDQWKRRSGDVVSESDEAARDSLDLEDYDAIGRMSEALSRHADEIYDSLGSDQARQLCGAMFKALTVRESENRGIRRPQTLGRLSEVLGVSMEEIKPIIEAYRQPGVTFLMPPSPAPLSDGTIIDISHESLMRVWVRLRDWVEEEAQSVGIFHRLTESAALHEAGKAGLYRDPELGIALSWFEEVHPNAAWADQVGGGFDRALAYLEQSRTEAEQEEKAREAARQRELEQAKVLAENQRLRAEERARSARRMKGLMSAAVVVAIGAGIAALIALDATRKAEEAEAKVADELYVADMNRAGQAYAEGSMGLLDDLLSRHSPRGPEWHLWRHASQRELASIPSPIGPSWGITVSPDQKTVAIKYWPGNIGLYDVDSRDLMRTLPVYGNDSAQQYSRRGLDIAYSPDGGTLAATGPHPFLRRWDTRTWQPISPDLVFPAGKTQALSRESYINSLAYSSDGSMLAASRGEAVAIWDCHSWNVLQVIDLSGETNTTTRVSKLVFSPKDNRLIASVYSGKQYLVILDTARGKVISKTPLTGPIRGIAYSPDGQWLAVATDGDVNLYSLSELSVPELPVPDLLVRTRGWTGKVCFSANGHFLAASSTEGNAILVWELQQKEPKEEPEIDPTQPVQDEDIKPSWRLVSTLKGHSKIAVMEFVGDEGELWSAGSDDQVKVWDIRKSRNSSVLPDAELHGRYLAGGRLVGNAPDKPGMPSSIRLYDVANARELPPWKGGELFTDFGSSDNGEFLAARDPTGQMRLWNSESGQLLGTTSPVFPGTNTTFRLLQVSNDGKHVVWQQLDSNDSVAIQVWNTSTDQHVRLPNTEFSAQWYAPSALSPDGTLFAYLGRLGSIYKLTVFDLVPEQPKVLYSQGTGGSVRILFSPDGTRLALGGYNNMIEFIDSRTGHSLGDPLSGHAEGIISLAFSPDGRTLFSSSADRTIRLWDTMNGAHLTTLPALENSVSYLLIMDPQGRWMVSKEIGQTVLWRFDNARDPARNEMLWAEEGQRACAIGDFKTARDVARRAVEMAPQQSAYEPWTVLAALAIDEKDWDEFRKIRWDMLAFYRKQPSMFLAEQTVLLYTMLPATADEVERAHSMALDMIEMGSGGGWPEEPGQLGLILADYRRGQYEETLAKAKIELEKGVLTRKATYEIPIKLVLAMSQHHLGQKAEARAVLNSVESEMTRRGWTSPGTPENPNDSWHSWMKRQALLDEAKALIE